LKLQIVDEKRGLWCYINGSSDNLKYEFCRPKTESEETCGGFRCQSYKGKQNKTVSGRTCQAWNTDSPHKRVEGINPASKPELESNYCRNPSDFMDTIWCYTTDPERVWEYCAPIGADWQYKDPTMGADYTPTLYWEDPYGLDTSALEDYEIKSLTQTKFRWMRPKDILLSGRPSLFGDKGILPGGVHQGENGDCWFLAAIAALAEYPERINKIFSNSEYSEKGIYQVEFFVKGEPIKLVVDDRVPVTG